jgi:hypothetical protein
MAAEGRCVVCGKTSDKCDCVCPDCGCDCFDDVTLTDHGRCRDCHKSILNGERENPDREN